jgi:hypothetical protein
LFSVVAFVPIVFLRALGGDEAWRLGAFSTARSVELMWTVVEGENHPPERPGFTPSIHRKIHSVSG